MTDKIEVPDYNVDELVAWVAEDPEARAEPALVVENEKEHPRSGVLKGIAALLAVESDVAEPEPAEPTPDVPRTPADAEAELAVELVKTGDDRDQDRIDALLAELGPQPGPAILAADAPAPPAQPADIGLLVSSGDGLAEGDAVAKPGSGYESITFPDGVTVDVDPDTGCVIAVSSD
jgi:hypothetical protein